MQTDCGIANLGGVQDLIGHGPEQSDLINPVQSKEKQDQLFFGVGGFSRSLPT